MVRKLTDLKYKILKQIRLIKESINALKFWWLRRRFKRFIEKFKKLDNKYYEAAIIAMFKDLHKDVILDSTPLKTRKKGKIITYSWAVLYTKYGNVKVEVWPDEILLKQTK